MWHGHIQTVIKEFLMKLSTLTARLGAVLLLGAIVCSVGAQTLDVPAAPMVGDKWTFRYHNTGDKKEPYLYFNEVKSTDGASTWIYGESQEPNSRLPKFVWRLDMTKAAFVERFEFDPAAANGAGKIDADRKANDSYLQFPLAVGKKYKVKTHWDNGKGFNEYTAEVEAFEKVKVEAGEFEAYRIKYSGFWNRRVDGNYSGRTEQVNWYAPAVRGSVKWIYTDRNSNGSSWNNSTTELIKWEPSAAK